MEEELRKKVEKLRRRYYLWELSNRDLEKRIGEEQIFKKKILVGASCFVASFIIGYVVGRKYFNKRE